MSNVTVYLKCDRNTKVQSPDVYMKDIAEVRCIDKNIAARLKAVKVWHFGKNAPLRCVVSTLRLVELMEESCPAISVQIVGETDVLIERVFVNKHKRWQQWFKAALVCLVSFFGTAFTIMAFHNDIGINEVFTEVYMMLMNKKPQGLNPLEVSYAIGLALGIITFFNHFGNKRLTKDPTPIEVAMRNYEQDVDMALIETAGREGKAEESRG